MEKEFFFEKLFINSELADDICRDLGISRKEYTELSNILDKEREKEIKEIKRIRSLYHNKKNNIDDFKKGFPDFNTFYKWYIGQWERQEGKCYYCDTEEHMIRTLFDKKYQDRKRTNRGRHLEVERKDAVSNLYNKENCVLACYFCNNDKSDIFNEDEYMDYLNDRKLFFTKQYEELTQ